MKHLACLFPGIFVYAARGLFAENKAEKRRLDIKTSVCLVWFGIVHRDSTSAWMHRKTLVATQRRPIAASVRAPTAIRSSMVFFRNTGVRVPHVLPKCIVFSLMLGIACSFARAQEQNVQLATAPA